MDGVQAAGSAQAIAAVNQVLQNAQQQSIEQSEKMVRFVNETALGVEHGKGAQFDAMA